ncbi:Putative 4-hydroxy-tetrahydrodipicolinate reductase 1 [Picochlorum sp. SENEW3]|nr:Putative 4-hydroxy-tetrahydrodipicolinate reductase 1 [Picochlorum sp. SENEW3]
MSANVSVAGGRIGSFNPRGGPIRRSQNIWCSSGSLSQSMDGMMRQSSGISDGYLVDTYGSERVRGRGKGYGRRVLSTRCQAASSTQQPAILVNSCTGKMGHATAEAVVRAGLTLIPYTFTGRSEAVAVGNVGVCGVPVELITAQERQVALDKIKADYPDLVVIDYTLPSAVNENALFYCENGIPFVMGTTGGDRDKLLEDVAASGVYAVIAPNMGKQIVAFQTMMESMAEEFPGCFQGYSLRVVESHQRTKADTSGTAKAVVQSFQKMGLSDFKESDIEKVREKEAQMFDMGVPEECIDGHAFHTYTLTSEDGSVTLEFKHNVCGRKVYAEGTVDAAIFLHQQRQKGAATKLYNMIDVLKAGAMR